MTWFLPAAEERYRMLLQERRVTEDVAFRRIGRTLSAERVIGVVAAFAGMDPEDLVIRQNDCRWRAVAARMLCRYGGLTQRTTATILGVRTGVAVCCQLRKLATLLQSDKDLANKVCRIEGRLDKELKQ